MTLFSPFSHVKDNKVVGGPATPFSRNLPQPQTLHFKLSDLSSNMMHSLVMGSDKISLSHSKKDPRGRMNTHTHTHIPTARVRCIRNNAFKNGVEAVLG